MRRIPEKWAIFNRYRDATEKVLYLILIEEKQVGMILRMAGDHERAGSSHRDHQPSTLPIEAAAVPLAQLA